jgi:hypothetical protein
MDLTNLSRGDLAELQHRLLVVSGAADVLAEGGLEPVIDLTDVETVVRAGPVRDFVAGEPPVAMVGPWTMPSSISSGNVFVTPPLAEVPDGVTVAAGAGDLLADEDPGPVVIEGVIPRRSALISDAETIDAHIWSMSRLGDWHMGADLAFLRAFLDHPEVPFCRVARSLGRDSVDCDRRLDLLSDGWRLDLRAVLARLEALVAAALDDEQVAVLEAADQAEQETGAGEAPQPEPAGEQAAEAPLPAVDVARGASTDGGQDLSEIQPGVTGPHARGGEAGQPPDPAAPAAESGIAAADDHSDPASEGQAPEPPAAVAATSAAVEAPARPGNPHAGAGSGADKYGVAWTVEEDAFLVNAVAQRVQAGMSMKAAAKEAAGLLGRSVGSTCIRAQKNLKDRIARSLVGRHAPEPATDVMKPVAEAAARVVEDVAARRIAAAPAKPLRPVAPDHLAGEHRRIWDCLDGLSTKPPFDPAADLAIYDAYDSGAGVGALALDWGVDAPTLVARYRDLIRCVDNGKGKIRPELKMKFSAVIRWRAEAFAKLKAA